jgi:hypothetical protein
MRAFGFGKLLLSTVKDKLGGRWEQGKYLTDENLQQLQM